MTMTFKQEKMVDFQWLDIQGLLTLLALSSYSKYADSL